MTEDPALDLVRRFAADRWLAHRHLFRHRHPDESAPAHRAMVADIYDSRPRRVIEGFRGFGKSTYLEEAAVLKACLAEFKNMVIVAASYSRACDRLAAVKREFEINEFVIRLFGMQKSADNSWKEGKIVLANGACIQALGRDQSMLGIKHLDWRPDAALVDDVEDPDEIRTDSEREQTWNWFIKTFLPSLDHPLRSWVRVLGTRRGSGSLPERLEKDRWPVSRYPVEHTDDDGRRRATWPAKFPLEIVDSMRATYRGDMHTWAQEYMCQPTSESDRTFGRDALRCEPRPRSWEAVFAMYDPARTAHRGSATTGKAVWSWQGRRLTVWENTAEMWLPDRIIADLFETQRKFDCTWIGFEEDGLSEWARQPIRAEMIRRGIMLPLLPVKAPRGKLDFIRGLQPYFSAGEITFAGTEEMFRSALDQFLSFPHGKIDAPNALAYALMLRPGIPVFDGFGDEHIAEDLEPLPAAPLFLAASSDGSAVTAVLVQRAQGEIRILADWVREGSPSEVVADIHGEAALGMETSEWRTKEEVDPSQPYKMPVRRPVLTRLPIRWIVPARHQQTWMNVGLMQAIRAIPQRVSAAPDAQDRGRIAINQALAEHRHGRPRLSVSTAARWTLRAFAGGYARSLDRRGLSAPQPDEGLYQLLMEGIEAFSSIGVSVDEPVEDTQPVAYDKRGVPYRSAMPARR